MTSRAEIRGGICFLRLDGELDRADLPELEGEIRSCLRQAPFLVLDFGAVSFLNGSVLSLLSDTLEDLPPGGWLGVLKPPAEIERLFGVARLSEHPGFRVFASMAEVVGHSEDA